jgi:hypothetical protein
MAYTLVATVGGGVTLARTLFVESHDWPHDRTQGEFDTLFTLAHILFAGDGGWWVYVRAGAQLQLR